MAGYVDRMTYTIERARLRVLEGLRDASRAAGETDRYVELVREVVSCERRIRNLLSARGS